MDNKQKLLVFKAHKQIINTVETLQKILALPCTAEDIYSRQKTVNIINSLIDSASDIGITFQFHELNRKAYQAQKEADETERLLLAQAKRRTRDQKMLNKLK